MNKQRRITRMFLDHLAGFYPYFLAFYFLSLILSVIFDSWRLFFNWPAFHVAIIILGALSLFSEKSREFFGQFHFSEQFHFSAQIKKRHLNWARKIWSMIIFAVKIAFQFLWGIGRAIGGFVLKKLRLLKKTDYLKAGSALIILGLAIFWQIEVMDFIFLAYGLMAVFFVIDSRVSALAAIIFLFLCPLLLSFKKDELTETMAVCAYYSLVITVIVQIREYLRQKKEEKKLSTP